VIAFYLPGGVPVYLFSLVLGIGATIGLAWMMWQAPAKAAVATIDAGLWALLGGVLGGRAVFVLAHWTYFQDHLGEAPQVQLGGMDWPGALLGAGLAVAIYAGFTRKSLSVLLDNMVLLAGAVLVSAWLACWLDGCGYGRSSAAWWAVPARDEWGTYARRIPVQLIGALLTLGTLWIMDRRRTRVALSGQIAALTTLLLSLEYAVLSLWRSDPTHSWMGIRLDTWTAILMTILAGMALLWISLTRKSDTGLE
jgi:phosphatidylglycerol:prolipoprotein diacylglycerol transferase